MDVVGWSWCGVQHGDAMDGRLVVSVWKLSIQWFHRLFMFK
jgi:hypothetical protein